jgi:hypothetical protein
MPAAVADNYLSIGQTLLDVLFPMDAIQDLSLKILWICSNLQSFSLGNFSNLSQ